MGNICSVGWEGELEREDGNAGCLPADAGNPCLIGGSGGLGRVKKWVWSKVEEVKL